MPLAPFCATIGKMRIKIYNTLTRKIEEFVPPEEEVKMYVCGLTPYDDTHIGHARCYMAFDAIRRYLESRGYKVNHVQNFTDMDDKIINRAKQVGMSTSEITEKYIASYFHDMDKLGILRAHHYPKVTEHIPDIINMINGIVERGAAYPAEGSVYFSVDAFPDYGKLSGRVTDEMRAGARVEVLEEKQNPLDFALWKKSEENEPGWDSPWGRGRPGWHIECSAMSIKYLGHGFTLHGGARDLIFPHHENEIAQSEAYAGKAPFVRYWAHVGFVTVNGEKMAKSLGNFVTVQDILNSYYPDVIRLYVLSTHYRNPIDFSIDDISKSVEGLNRLSIFRDRIRDTSGQGIAFEYKQRKDLGNLTPEENELTSLYKECEKNFHAAMEDDFNTSQAIGELFKFVLNVNKFLDGNQSKIDLLKNCIVEHSRKFSDLCDSLGLFSVGGMKSLYEFRDRIKNTAVQVIELEYTQRKETGNLMPEENEFISLYGECEKNINAAMEDNSNKQQAIKELSKFVTNANKFIDKNQTKIDSLKSCIVEFSRKFTDICNSLGFREMPFLTAEVLSEYENSPEEFLLKELEVIWQQFSKDVLFEEPKKDMVMLNLGFMRETNLMGITLREPEEGNIQSYIQALVDLRLLYRKQKNFKASDEIRNKLKELGIILEDTKDGTTWRFDEFGV